MRIAFGGTLTALTLALAATVAPTTGAGAADLRWIDQSRGAIDTVIDELFVRTFNEEHPDTPLTITRQEEHEKFVRMLIEANNAPDLIQLNGPSELVDLAETDRIIPLDAYAEKYGWKDKILPWAYESGTVNGKLYAVPITYESLMLFYNKDALAQHGLEVPRSLEEIEQVCQKAKEAGVACFANATGGKASRGEWYIGWHLNAGAGPDALYAVLRREQPWSSLKSHFERNLQWIRDGWYGGRQDIYFALSFDEAWAMLSSGQALMRVAGSWDLRRMVEFCNEACDWVPAPSLSPSVPEHYELAIGETLSISADSADPDAAAAALDHLFNDKERAARIIEGSNFSAWMVPLSWEEEDFSPDVDPRLVHLPVHFSELTAEGRFGYTSWTFLPPKTRSYLFEGFEAMLMNNTSIDEYLAKLQETFDSEKDSVPPLPKPTL